MLRAALVVSAFAGLLVEPAAAAAGTSPQAHAVPVSQSDLGRLERGEVVLLAAEERAAGTAAAAVLIRASVERVWAVMIDCPRAPEFVPKLRRCRVLEQGDGRRLVEHRVKPFALLPVLTYVFEERWEERRRIAFRRAGGDLAAMAGSWDLEPAGETATLVRYQVSVDPGFPLPRWSIRRALRHDLPLLLDALRDRVEGWEKDSP